MFDEDDDEEEQGTTDAGEAGPLGGSRESGSQEGDAAAKPAKKKQHVSPPVYQVRICHRIADKLQWCILGISRFISPTWVIQ